MDINVEARKMVDEGLVVSMAEGRRYAAAGMNAEQLKERREKYSQPLAVRRDYGSRQSAEEEKDVKSTIEALKDYPGLAEAVKEVIETAKKRPYVASTVAERIYGALREMGTVREAAEIGQTAYIDHIGGMFEVRLPDGSVVKEPDSDEAYAAVQKYAMRVKKNVKLVDVEKGMTKTVDKHGNIEDSTLKSAGDSSDRKDLEDKMLELWKTRKKQFGTPISDKDVEEFREWLTSIPTDAMHRAVKGGGRLATEGEDPSKQFKSFLEGMKGGRDVNETIRALLNERLVSSIGEARRLAQEGWTVEEVKKIRGGKDWSKGKWSSEDVSKRLDVLADRLEACGLREAAEKLDVVSNTIDAGWKDKQKAIDNVEKAMHMLGWQGGTVHQVVDETGLSIDQIHNADDIESLVREALKKKGRVPKEAVEMAGEPYIVEQLKREGFDVTRYPGDVETRRTRSEDLPVKNLGRFVTYSWRVTAPADQVFNVGGVEQEEVVLDTEGEGYKEYKPSHNPEDKRYLIYESYPRALDRKFKPKLIASSDKEQDLISKLKRMLKPAGSLK
jgi:hypothetical protein